MVLVCNGYKYQTAYSIQYKDADPILKYTEHFKTYTENLTVEINLGLIICTVFQMNNSTVWDLPVFIGYTTLWDTTIFVKYFVSTYIEGFWGGEGVWCMDEAVQESF